MTEFERGLGKRWFEQVWNEGRREAIAEMLAPNAVVHEGGADTTGPAGFYPFFDRIRATLSAMHVSIEDSIADGDKICVRWSCTGKHTGEGLGIPATGAAIHVTGITIVRVADGMMVEGWQNWDMLGMMEQIKGMKASGTYIGAA